MSALGTGAVEVVKRKEELRETSGGQVQGFVETQESREEGEGEMGRTGRGERFVSISEDLTRQDRGLWASEREHLNRERLDKLGKRGA